MSEYFIGSDGELYHYGIKGMKWGVRRYQRRDGTLTEAGKKRIRDDSDMLFYDHRRKERKLRDPVSNRKAIGTDERLKQASEEYRNIAIKEKDRLLKDQTELKKAGYLFINNPDSDIQEHNSDIMAYILPHTSAMKQAQKKYTETEVDVFAEALLADMRFKNTEKAKQFVKSSLIENNRIVQRHLGLLDNKDSQKIQDEIRFYSNGIKSEIAGKYASEINTAVNSKTYKSKEAKRKAIDDAYRKKMSEVEKLGDEWLSDQFWQQWNFAHDRLDEE